MHGYLRVLDLKWMKHTCEIPWLDAVEVDVADNIEVDLLGGHLLAEIVADELLVGGVEPEPGRDA